MTNVFPFDLPTSTSLYLVLFVATLVIHFIFMSYVLAGSVWVLVGLFGSKEKPSVVVDTLKDWIPLMLSGAITAGVAPLLFIQVLYRQQFYTANLLQFHRWMAILPVLIVLFYLAYLVKAQGDRHSIIQRAAAAICVCCVLFVAWSWSGNHVLSLQSHDIWQDQYASGVSVSQQTVVGLRLALWITMTFPVLSCLLMWQLRNPRSDAGNQPPGVARTSAIAICGTVAAVVMAIATGSQLPETSREALMSGNGVLWLFSGGLGTIVQFSAWIQRFRCRQDTLVTRAVITLGIVLQLWGVMMCREVVRTTNLGDRVDFAGHADAATSEGFLLFLLFCGINGTVAGWCIRLVRHGRSDDAGSE